MMKIVEFGVSHHVSVQVSRRPLCRFVHYLNSLLWIHHKARITWAIVTMNDSVCKLKSVTSDQVNILSSS